jgi:hypothetical protein
VSRFRTWAEGKIAAWCEAHTTEDDPDGTLE